MKDAKPPEPITILLDMDDTICYLTDEWIRVLNKTHGTEIKRTDFIARDVSEVLVKKFPVTKEQIYKPLDQVGLFKSLKIMPGVIESLTEMKKLGWRVVIVTSLPTIDHLPSQIVKEKLEWLEENLGGLIKPRDVIITYVKNLIKGDVLIDDAPHNLNDYPGKTIVFDNPWNQEVRASKRVFHWDEMVDACKELLNNEC